MRFLILVLSFMLIPISHAAMLKGVNGVELLAIDGQKLKTGGMFSDKNYNLADGKHQVVVKYTKRLNEQNMVYSRPTIFSINVVGDTEIKVRDFANVNQAESAIRNGLTWIVKNSKKTINVTDADELFEEGFQIKPDLEKLIFEYNQKNNLVPSAAIAKSMSDIPSSPAKNSKVDNKTQQLITIYRASSLEEKKAFRMWLLEQDIK
ncbi:MAG: DUF2057 domain-containing protein [Psychromonas sp.]